MRPPGKQGTLDAPRSQPSSHHTPSGAWLLSDDEGRGLAAAIMRDQPVVIQNSYADEHVVLRGLILTA